MNSSYNRKREGFFEGWYVKMAGTKGIALIPGIHLNSKGNGYAFIQVIKEDTSWYIKFPAGVFRKSNSRFAVKIGRNLFTEKGIRVDLRGKGLMLKGRVSFGKMVPLRYPVMGPFCLLKNMQCSHEIISLKHPLEGFLTINGEQMNFDGGQGYIEGDRGRSFPRRYMWVQGMEQKGNTSIVAAAADVPLGTGQIRGCLCVIYYRGMEYRMATYLGVKIVECTPYGIVLRQGRDLLLVDILSDLKSGQKLKAPVMGEMKRRIIENVSAKARFRYYRKNRKMIDFVTDQAGYEWVE